MQQQILELRQYTHHPGTRETLIELFERAFMESQEQMGMSVVGQFRAIDDPDRFVWMRGFPTMEARAEALRAFYDGPVWLANRDTANATLIDSDDVLLLRPVRAESAFTFDGPNANVYVATVYLFDRCAEEAFATTFEHAFVPLLERAGARVRASFVTEHAPNTYPRLPVREGEHAFVWFAAYADEEAYRRVQADLEADDAWRQAVAELADDLRAVEVRRLAPTTKSRLR